jgi:hypothetical protein
MILNILLQVYCWILLPWKLTNARHIFTLRPWLHFVSVYRNVLYIQKIKTFNVEFSLCVHIFFMYVYYTVFREMTGSVNWNVACIRKSEEVVFLISIFIMWISLRLRDGEILDWSVRKGRMKFCAPAVCSVFQDFMVCNLLMLSLVIRRMLLWTRKWTFEFHKRSGVFGPEMRLLVSLRRLRFASRLFHTRVIKPT